ncbi:hypothetical protein ACRAWF_23845 [Streptomyces sp. L7]
MVLIGASGSGEDPRSRTATSTDRGVISSGLCLGDLVSGRRERPERRPGRRSTSCTTSLGWPPLPPARLHWSSTRPALRQDSGRQRKSTLRCTAVRRPAHRHERARHARRRRCAPGRNAAPLRLRRPCRAAM